MNTISRRLFLRKTFKYLGFIGFASKGLSLTSCHSDSNFRQSPSKEGKSLSVSTGLEEHDGITMESQDVQDQLSGTYYTTVGGLHSHSFIISPGEITNLINGETVNIVTSDDGIPNHHHSFTLTYN